MVHNVLSLSYTLIDAKVEKCHTTEIFWAEGNSSWKGLVHSQLVKNGLNSFSLDLVEDWDLKSCDGH
jgi:hypothetical protein